MILIDAVFIHNGGGRILLDYLISKLNFNTHEFVFLLDKRMEPYFTLVGAEVYYAKNILERNKFYSSNQKRFRKVFCMGNIPPHFKIDGYFINYLHSSYYVSKLDKTYLKHYIITNIKKLYFKLFVKNVDLWVVQTASMKDQLTKSSNVNPNKIDVLPFYNALGDGSQSIKDPDTFLYVSNGSPHKNHVNLITAFCNFYDQFKKGKLILTVSDYCVEICKIIAEKVEKGYPIINHGFVDREILKTIYKSSTFVVFPSLTESFGLGLIEACEFDCKILASNLDFVHEICIPSLFFNPYKVEEIENAFIEAVTGDLPFSTLKAKNEIEGVLNLIHN